MENTTSTWNKSDRIGLPTTAIFRRPRQAEPDKPSIRLSETLQPFAVIPWDLGVPIGIGVMLIVVRDGDYTADIERLEGTGFDRSIPNRAPGPEIREDHLKPQQMLEQIDAGYKRLDQSSAVFDYPDGGPAEKGLQVYLFPNSFAHPFQGDNPPLCGRNARYSANKAI
ncbi:hypothetical protein DSL72_008247 [Monilinia vaccinii-corymbosi]|uniref:Uncharacterized protein n=1 Tax=Monilinia vaccinii-corymbosi TaxID=61207 RepID=A0A8A3PJ42_9HELO|nr:hypothetical protein DSL72_008247 [Monilinia vaccinii-corymbosi]